jgi:hypothetical protein
MGRILGQFGTTDDATPEDAGVRCPLCAVRNRPGQFCAHVRWTFDQGDPLEFARFAVETSPYVRARGGSASDIPEGWWSDQGAWIVDQVLLHFDATDGYVFGDLAALDLLARDVWKAFRPEAQRPSIARVDPF